jgi:hypothetical protein
MVDGLANRVIAVEERMNCSDLIYRLVGQTNTSREKELRDCYTSTIEYARALEDRLIRAKDGVSQIRFW